MHQSKPSLPRVLLVLLVVTLLSCARGDKPADTAAVARSAAAQPLAASAYAPSAGLPGALPKPLAAMSGDEFHSFAHSLAYGGGTSRVRKCRKDPACDPQGGNKRTSARVDAVNGQDSLMSSPVPRNGVIVVRARNTGAYVEARYGMQPGPYEYYMVVLPDTGGRGSWRLQQVDTTAGAHAMTQIASGTFQRCPHQFTKVKFRANFYSCDNAHQAGDTVVRLGLMQTGSDDIAAFDPIWTSCAKGCCIAQ